MLSCNENFECSQSLAITIPKKLRKNLHCPYPLVASNASLHAHAIARPSVLDVALPSSSMTMRLLVNKKLDTIVDNTCI
jgi:hypothetical protein